MKGSGSGPLVASIHHVSLLVADTGRALEFYRDLLGLEQDPRRPELGYPGVWLAIGDRQLHLSELPNPDAAAGRPEHAGHDRHLALQVTDIDFLQQRLERAGIPFTRSRSGRAALFCRDPDGNGLEFISA